MSIKIGSNLDSRKIRDLKFNRTTVYSVPSVCFEEFVDIFLFLLICVSQDYTSIYVSTLTVN